MVMGLVYFLGNPWGTPRFIKAIYLVFTRVIPGVGPVITAFPFIKYV